MDPIKQLRAALAAKLAERATHRETMTRLAALTEGDEKRSLTTEEDSEFTTARAAVKTIDTECEVLTERIAELVDEEARDLAAANLRKELKIPVGGARIDSEPRTYTPDTSRQGRSIFTDQYRAQHLGDVTAGDRLNRHSREVIVENELRATTTASFAGLVVPQYLVDDAALIARQGRPTANVVQRRPLPEQGTSFNIPRGTTGATVASQTPENTNVSSTDEVWSNLTITMVTIAGQQDVSRQSIERGTPGLDELIYSDLAGAYAAELDRQVLNGSGASGQMLGILQTASINAPTTFGAAPTAATFYSKVAGGVQAVAANRYFPADHIIMAPRRWGWLQSLVDTQNRPLVVGQSFGPYNAASVLEGDGQGYGNVVGWLQGLPVITDANIPLTVGTESEDQVVIFRASDSILWEDGDGMPRQFRFEQTLGNQLTIKIVVAGYAAFTAGRYPKSVSYVGGLDTLGATFGLVSPVF